MKINLRHLFIAPALLAAITLNSELPSAFAQGAAFTYQGAIELGDLPTTSTTLGPSHKSRGSRLRARDRVWQGHDWFGPRQRHGGGDLAVIPYVAPKP